MALLQCRKLLSRGEGHCKCVHLCPLLSGGVCVIADFLRTMAWDERSCCLTIHPSTNCIYGLPWKCLVNSWAWSRMRWPVCLSCSSEMWFLPARSLMKLLEGRSTFGNFYSAVTVALSLPVQRQIIWTNTSRRITTLFLLIKQNASFLLISSPSDFKPGFWLEGSGLFYLLFLWAKLGDFVVCKWLPSNPSVHADQYRWQKALAWWVCHVDAAICLHPVP